MASKEEIAQLKKTVKELRKGQLEILLRLENLEDRMSALEEGGFNPKEPEPILTCVQCSAEYKESENAEGGCKFHDGELKSVRWDYKYTCCDESSQNYDAARSLPGCTKGKHCSKHHTNYPYAAYNFYMAKQSREAKEVWLTLDVEDHVTECCEWAEVGLSGEGKVLVLVGTSRIKCTAYVDFAVEELKQCEEPSFTVLDKSDRVGWAINARVDSSDSVANAIIVSIKPASSKIPLVKRVELVFDGDTPRPGKVECLSDPTPQNPTLLFALPEDSYKGPKLEAGEDYSQDRKNDYETETNNGCQLQLKQVGYTEVESATPWTSDGKWNNLFTVNVKVTNIAQENLSVIDVIGEYMNKDGEWVKCDQVWISKEHTDNRYDWIKLANFRLDLASHPGSWYDATYDPASTATLAARLAITFTENPPGNSYKGRWAHHSLPQPLHLRVTFVDQEQRSASLQFEQGNPPRPFATRESRQKEWSKKKPLEFHLFADDVNRYQRSDAAIFYDKEPGNEATNHLAFFTDTAGLKHAVDEQASKDDKGVLCYRPAPNGNAMHTFYISSSITSAVYNAMRARKGEYELKNMRKDSKGSTIQIFVVVDQDSGMARALKVTITTPTSSATGYYLLPWDDASKATLTLEPDEVGVKQEFTVTWSVPRASKSDRIEVYPLYGKSDISYSCNEDGVVSGSTELEAPDVPGQYELRYYPAWLSDRYTGCRHDIFWAAKQFTVSGN